MEAHCQSWRVPGSSWDPAATPGLGWDLSLPGGANRAHRGLGGQLTSLLCPEPHPSLCNGGRKVNRSNSSGEDLASSSLRGASDVFLEITSRVATCRVEWRLPCSGWSWDLKADQRPALTPAVEKLEMRPEVFR